ncbi:unnamed protein product [Schistosoma mattheei]|uniref:Uncharacterized protein n=1 Tax=Schistosoma mattheei TaxID=31246 RepID=A0A3P8FLS8_9TREM|nr:unnamed protein product [Schistosoma mattheei]
MHTATLCELWDLVAKVAPNRKHDNDYHNQYRTEARLNRLEIHRDHTVLIYNLM